MPCLVKDSNGRPPFWVCCYTTADGRRLKKSTKQTDRTKAMKVCHAFVEADNAIATKSVTEQQLRKVINDTLARVGERPLSDPSVKQQLDSWIDSKRGAVSEASLVAYDQARGLFLKFLGTRSGQSVRAINKNDATQFRDQLLKEGRTPITVNKLVKRYL